MLVTAAGGEGAPALRAPPSRRALGGFGQSILVAAAEALDAGPALATAPTRDLSIGSQILDGWGVRLLVGLLLLSLVVCTLDVLARARRRKAPVAPAIGWVLSFAAPFLLAGLFAIFLGAGGLLPATPAAPVTSAQLPPGAAGVAALVSVGLLFVLAWVLRAAVRRRPRGARADRRPPRRCWRPAALLAFLVWLANPYTALLLIVPLHVWLVALTRERPAPPVSGGRAGRLAGRAGRGARARLRRRWRSRRRRARLDARAADRRRRPVARRAAARARVAAGCAVAAGDAAARARARPRAGARRCAAARAAQLRRPGLARRHRVGAAALSR